MNKRGWCVLAACMLAACTNEKFVGRPGLDFRQGDLPPPARTDFVQRQRSYLIGPFDKVSIEVYGVAELTRTVQVDASGSISLPLAGTIQAAGLTPIQLSALIAGKLRNRYVRDPQVTVNTDTVNQLITVDGSVQKPGQFPVVGRLTLQQAIARAEGTTEFARTNYVVVFRKVNDQDMAALYDLRAIREGAYADPEVFANDIVYVGDDSRARAFRALESTGAILLAPVITLLR